MSERAKPCTVTASRDAHAPAAQERAGPVKGQAPPSAHLKEETARHLIQGAGDGGAELGAGGDAQFAVDAGEVGLHRLGAEEQGLGDLAVGVPGRGQGRDAFLGGGSTIASQPGPNTPAQKAVTAPRRHGPPQPFRPHPDPGGAR